MFARAATLLLAWAALPSAANAAEPRVQTAAEALAGDAVHYAARHGVTAAEALRRLQAQHASTVVTDRIARVLGDRLAGISIQHAPQYRIHVLLTGTQVVADQAAVAAGSPVPVVFELGAQATRTQLLGALQAHGPALKARMPHARGMGVDQRTGALVVYLMGRDPQAQGIAALQKEAEALTGVPVRIALAEAAVDMVRGGERVAGIDPDSGRRNACTTGFVVADPQRTGIITAAHCPDALVYEPAGGAPVVLEFAGEWGVGTRDVQVNVGAVAAEPLFFADRGSGALRRVAGARPRASTRAGDFLCHYGESSGYSCAEVELTDFAPPGDLCAGPCAPVWTTVKGPQCRTGDSGGPVFSGATAYGILKGGNAISSRCNFYYYMSTDFLPGGWRLLQEPDAQPGTAGARGEPTLGL